MVVKIPLKVPRVGMKVISKGSKDCCYGMEKGEVGDIHVVLPNQVEFELSDWKGERFTQCIQCCWEMKEV